MRRPYRRPPLYRRVIPETRFVYFARPGLGAMRVRDAGVVKIGIADNPAVRVRELKASLIFAVEEPADDAARLERALHEQFALAQVVNTPCGWMGHRLEGREWFVVDERLRLLIGACLNLGYWPWSRKPLLIAAEGLDR